MVAVRTLSILLRYRRAILVLCAPVLIVIVAFCIRTYLQMRLLASLIRCSRRPDAVRVEPEVDVEHVHLRIPYFKEEHIVVRAPSWAFTKSGSDVIWITPPFGEVNEIYMSACDGIALKHLGSCRSLSVLSIKRPVGAVSADWNRILGLPLRALGAVEASLPTNGLARLAQPELLKELMVFMDGPFDEDAAASIGKCTQLELLLLEYVKGLADADLAAAVSKLSRLRTVSLRGDEVGELSVLALQKLESLEEVSIECRGVHAEALEGLAGCRRLRIVGVTSPAVDDGVLSAFMKSASISECILQRDNLTSEKIEEFRERRPDVKLHLVGSWSSVKPK